MWWKTERHIQARTVLSGILLFHRESSENTNLRFGIDRKAWHSLPSHEKKLWKIPHNLCTSAKMKC